MFRCLLLGHRNPNSILPYTKRRERGEEEGESENENPTTPQHIMASSAICAILSPPSNQSLLLLRARRSTFLSHRFPTLIRTRAVPVIIKAVQIPAGIVPGKIVETDKLPSDVRDKAMAAVDSFGGRVTIGDVAGKAGLKVNDAETALQAIAADSDGFLEVSDEGDVLYVFPKDYRLKLASKSFRMKIEPFLDKSKSAFEYVIRVSFGTALIASIVLVYTAIITILSSRSDDDNRGRRGGRSYNSGFNLFFRPSDLFWYWDPYYYRRTRTKTNNGMNFIESVFSFVFGDGDPNEGLEEERWKLIGQYISSNGGVIAGEELAPYLDVSPNNETLDDESYVLPVLLRFDGHPEVNDEGDILYRFPSLQRTASSQGAGRKEYVGKRWSDWVAVMNKYFKEEKWAFSKTTASEKAMVVGLGALNFFGVVILGTMLQSTTTTSKSLISFVSDIFPILQIYATTFFAIPLGRWLLLKKTNTEIEKRNKARQDRAQLLEQPDALLRRKLLSAKDMAKRTVISNERIVYSTDRDISDQDFEEREWDRRLRERN